MARYEYLCKDCGDAFELERPMADAEVDVRCPAGHTQVRRRFSVFAVPSSGASPGSSGSRAPAASAGGGGGGCCGGGCGCR